MGDFGSHAHRLTQRRVRVDGLADIDRIAAHFDGQADFADHVTGVRADDGPANDAMRFGIEDQIAKTAIGVVGNSATGNRFLPSV